MSSVLRVTTTIIINEAPYGKERAWNAIRLAQAMIAKGEEVNVFLLEDGVSVAKEGQNPPAGYYNLERMLKELIERGAEVRACGTCCAARGLSREDLMSGVKMSGIMDLAGWVKKSQHVLAF